MVCTIGRALVTSALVAALALIAAGLDATSAPAAAGPRPGCTPVCVPGGSCPYPKVLAQDLCNQKPVGSPYCNAFCAW
jgi:hypothetical protein